MTSYSLSTLLKVRERNKELADRHFLNAKLALEEEEQKLSLIKEQLDSTRKARATLQDHFFHKAQNDPYNKREVTCLANSSKKNICDEQMLKHSLIEQLEQVKNAESNKHLAFKNALEANRDLKAISKHHVLWQQREKKSEELRVEYDADDQNCVRFWLNKRV